MVVVITTEGDGQAKARSTSAYTKNPNGSNADTAARCWTLRTHPQDHATRTRDAVGSDDGLAIFKAARAWFEQANRHTGVSLCLPHLVIDVTDAKKSFTADFGLSDRGYAHVEKTLDEFQTELVSSLACGANCSYKSTLHWLKTLQRTANTHLRVRFACRRCRWATAGQLRLRSRAR